MKKIVFTLVLICLLACKEDKEDRNTINNEESLQQNSIEKKAPRFEVIDNVLIDPNLTTLSTAPYAFADNIVFEEVNILKTAEETYTLVYVIDPFATDFDELKKWKIGVMFFAQDPSKFKDPIAKAKGFKSFGLLSDLKSIENEVVIVYENLKIEPKQFNYIRTYLYDASGNIFGEIYSIEDVKLP